MYDVCACATFSLSAFKYMISGAGLQEVKGKDLQDVTGIEELQQRAVKKCSNVHEESSSVCGLGDYYVSECFILPFEDAIPRASPYVSLDL